MSDRNDDGSYPDNDWKSGRIQKYVEDQIVKIVDIVEETEKELGDRFCYFKSELGDYFNEI